MSSGDMIFWAGIFVTNIIIATVWAKYGLLEIGLMRPPSRGVTAAMVCAIAVLGISIVAHLISGWSPQMERWAQVAVIAIPLVWLFFYRYVVLPGGLYEYNRAKIGTEYWAMQFFQPGHLDAERAGMLAHSDRAQKAAALFDKAIEKQSRGTSVASFDRTLAFRDDDVLADEIQTTCPACDGEVSIPWEVNRNVNGRCHHCGASLVARIDGHTMRLRAVTANPDRAVTPLNKKSLVAIYAEKAWLLRMMGRTEEALKALAESERLNEDLLSADAGDRDRYVNKSLILFRRAEIRHAQGRLDEARAGYTASLEIDRRIGDRDGEAATEGILSALAQE
jgi:tetratricopeptide (TPR) repeat protein